MSRSLLFVCCLIVLARSEDLSAETSLQAYLANQEILCLKASSPWTALFRVSVKVLVGHPGDIVMSRQ